MEKGGDKSGSVLIPKVNKQVGTWNTCLIQSTITKTILEIKKKKDEKHCGY
jgi:hypothetical protein